MKTEDVKIGGTYETRIGQNLCRVVVVDRKEGSRGWVGAVSGKRYNKRRASFSVRRENETRTLPKPRSAAALREIPACRWCVGGNCPKHPRTGNEVQA